MKKGCLVFCAAALLALFMNLRFNSDVQLRVKLLRPHKEYLAQM